MASDKLNRRKQLERYLEGVHKGEADAVLQSELGLTPGAFAHLKDNALSQEVERVQNTTTEQTYIEYCMVQRGCIKDLNELIDRCNLEGKNLPTVVTAVRTRSDIIDKMIKLGQEFGILEKKPEEKRLVAGVVVTQLSNEELREAITSQISSLNGLVNEYGNKKFVDVEPGELYRELPEATVIEAKLETEPEPEPAPEPEPKPEPKPEPAPRVDPRAVSERARRLMATPSPRTGETDKRNRAKSNKVHRGRRVVKPPMR